MSRKLTILQLFVAVGYVLSNAASGDTSFEKFLQDFGKTYSSKEINERKAIFQQNLRKINEHNQKFTQGQVSYTMGINQFSDLTMEEFQKMINGLPPVPKETSVDVISETTLKLLNKKYENYTFEDNFSYIDQGVVTTVKDQGQCGSCAAFAVTGAIESCFALKSGIVFDDLSEQFLVDCAYGYSYAGFEARGCDGAWPIAYLGFLPEKHAGKHQMESAYPYIAENGDCSFTQDGYYNQGAVLYGLNYYGTKESDLMKILHEYGPVVTTLNSTPLKSYSGGIFQSDECCNAATTNPPQHCTAYNNHAVLVVGYGTDETSGLDYWLVKNSWSTRFGEEGYFKIKRGVGHCGFGWQSNNVPIC